MMDRRVSTKEPQARPLNYNVQDDVEKLTKFFNSKWGSLEDAKVALGWGDEEQEYDIEQFEMLLHSWGVKVASVTDLFDQIDMDYSGKVSVQELFGEIERPLEELKFREQQRKNNELKRIYDAFAQAISHSGHQSIEGAFAGFGTTDEMSVAQFMTFSKQTLSVELTNEQLRRAFEEIDADSGGAISLSELKEALQSNVNRKTLETIACHLVDECGGISKLVDEVKFFAIQTTKGDRSPGGASVGHLDGTTSRESQDVSLDRDADTGVERRMMVRALKKMDVIPEVAKEETVNLLFKSLEINSAEMFAKKLEEEHEHYAREQKRKKQDDEHRDKLRQRELRRLLRFENKDSTRQHVVAWGVRAETQGARPEEVTRACAAEARAGRARTQLKDYVEELQLHLQNREGERNRFQQRLKEEQEGTADLVGDFFPLQQTPRSSALRVRRSRGSDSAVGADSRPITPETPHAGFRTPASLAGSMTPGMTMRSASTGRQGVSKAKRAEQLVQAAASGNVQELRRCLDGHPDAVGWAGVTPLMAAARHGRGEALHVLLEARADVLRTDVRGRTALDHAFRRPETEEQLREWGAFTGRELQRQATDLARRVLLVEEERRRLEAKCAKLPSKEVRERMVARAMRGGPPDASPKESPEASPRISPVASPRVPARSRGGAGQMLLGRGDLGRVFAEDLGGSGDLGRMLAEAERRRSPAGGAEVAPQLPSALARRTPSGSAPVKKDVRITLPVEPRHGR